MSSRIPTPGARSLLAPTSEKCGNPQKNDAATASDWRWRATRSSQGDRSSSWTLGFAQLRQRLIGERTSQSGFKRIEYVLDREWLPPQPAVPGVAGFQRGLVR